jgi:anti-anti-sigma factor
MKIVIQIDRRPRDGDVITPVSLEIPDFTGNRTSSPVSGSGTSIKCNEVPRCSKTHIYRSQDAIEFYTPGGSPSEEREMEIRCEESGKIQVVYLSGKIEGTTAEMFGRDMGEIIASGNRQVLLDLAGVSYINSAGLRVILVTTKSLKKPGDRYALCGLSEEVRRIFELAGFTRILRVYPTVEDALSQWTE